MGPSYILHIFYILNRKFNQRMDKIRIFSKIRTLFSIFKKGNGGVPSPPQLRAGEWSVAEYASISLNMCKCPWKCLNKLFWLCQNFENYWSFDMFGRLLKMSQVLTRPGFWIWHGLYMQGLRRVPHASVMPEYAWIKAYVSQYAWTWLNITDSLWICLQNAWINCSDYASPMDTSSSIRHRFDVEIPHGKFVEITSILKGESTWKLWHRFDMDISTWIRLSKSTNIDEFSTWILLYPFDVKST